MLYQNIFSHAIYYLIDQKLQRPGYQIHPQLRSMFRGTTPKDTILHSAVYNVCSFIWSSIVAFFACFSCGHWNIPLPHLLPFCHFWSTSSSSRQSTDNSPPIATFHNLLVLLISNINTNEGKGVLHMSRDRSRSAKYSWNVLGSEIEESCSRECISLVRAKKDGWNKMLDLEMSR